VLTMILNVENTYYNLLYQREQYKVQEDNLNRPSRLLDENTIRRQTGSSRPGRHEPRSRRRSAQTSYPGPAKPVRNSEDSLLQLLGDREFRNAVGEIKFPSSSSRSLSIDVQAGAGQRPEPGRGARDDPAVQAHCAQAKRMLRS